MLIFGRNLNQTVEIRLPDGRVGVVKLVDHRPDKVRLGFDFPNDVRVDRGEIAERIRKENAAAAQVRVGAERAQVAAPAGAGGR